MREKSPGHCPGSQKIPMPLSLGSLSSLGTSETRLQVHEAKPVKNLARCLHTPCAHPSEDPGGAWSLPREPATPPPSNSTIRAREHRQWPPTDVLAPSPLAVHPCALCPISSAPGVTSHTPPTPRQPRGGSCVGRMFACHTLEGVTGIQQVEARDAAQHPATPEGPVSTELGGETPGLRARL